MTSPSWQAIAGGLLAVGMVALALWGNSDEASLSGPPAGREEVLFWHFWGGADRGVVEQVVARFNARQDRFWVRPVAMPGNNLDLKIFLSVTGGDPPDLINQDDPIVADWAARGALTPLDELAAPGELERLRRELYPAALRLGEYGGRLFALTNGLDIRALYFNRTLLDEFALTPPRSLADLDRIATTIAPPEQAGSLQRVGFLPDSRRLWAYGYAFGGRFYDEETGRVTCAEPPIVAALAWMQSYRERYGTRRIQAFQTGDQSLPGKPFPLLAGRYAVLMDGQWRVRDIAAAQQAQRDRGEPVTEYGVCPFPPGPDGLVDAGWVNGNFFVVPRGARNAQGAWEFMKFWIGLGDAEAPREAARTCLAGGWIPVLRATAETAEFRDFLHTQPLFAEFVRLATSPHQRPTPLVPGAPYFYRTINDTAERAMLDGDAAGPSPRALLQQAQARIEEHLQRLRQPRAAIP